MKQDSGIGTILAKESQGIKEQIKALMPDVRIAKEVNNAKIKQAILDLTPQDYSDLFARYGQQEVLDFLASFVPGRRW